MNTQADTDSVEKRTVLTVECSICSVVLFLWSVLGSFPYTMFLVIPYFMQSLVFFLVALSGKYDFLHLISCIFALLASLIYIVLSLAFRALCLKTACLPMNGAEWFVLVIELVFQGLLVYLTVCMMMLDNEAIRRTQEKGRDKAVFVAAVGERMARKLRLAKDMTVEVEVKAHTQ